MIKALKSDIAILAVLLGALGAQVPHAKEVFALLENAPNDARWHGYAYAISLESAVLIFVVNGCKAESYFFAGVSILINLCYYALTGHSIWQLQATPSWIISLALPIVIARYSHLVAKHAGQDATLHFDWRAWWAKARAWWPTDAPTPVQADAVPMQTPANDSVECTNDVQPVHDNRADVQADAPSLKERALQLKSEGLKNVQIAQELGVHRNKVTELLK